MVVQCAHVFPVPDTGILVLRACAFFVGAPCELQVALPGRVPEEKKERETERKEKRRAHALDITYNKCYNMPLVQPTLTAALSYYSPPTICITDGYCPFFIKKRNERKKGALD